MDNFFKESYSYVPVDSPSFQIQRTDKHFFLGSCFAENLYSYYNQYYLPCHFSPFGNIYNPLSLSKSIEILCNDKLFDLNNIFEHIGLWRHFDFDTKACLTQKKEYEAVIKKEIELKSKALADANYLYLTLGTAYVYKDKKTGEVVNNCHKLPSSHFIREKASIEIMKEKMASAFSRLLEVNSKIQIIISLSPVRHLRDSPQENSLSKALLRCLIEELIDDFPLYYFPSYEIMLDQLRDYRWYNNDLAHPNDQAVEYIMKRFIDEAGDETLKEYLQDIKKLNNRLNHKILHKEIEESQRFIEGTQNYLDKMKQKYSDSERLQLLNYS